MEKVSNHRLLKNNWSAIIIVFLTPLLWYFVSAILPTHDDWTSLTRPTFAPFFTKERFFLYGNYWRPFDSMIGYVAGRNPQALFPAFHHILVVVGHVLCSLLVLRLLSVLRFGVTSRNVATVFFFITPAAMATVTAVDSQNQVYSLLCGIVSFLLYVGVKKGKYLLWAVFVFLAALFKENGLMWALICPLLAYGFDFIDRKSLRKDLLAGIGIMAMYALAIVLQPKDIVIQAEYIPGVMKIIKNMVKFMFTSFVTVDYVYLLHQPNRNMWMAAITFLMALPFIYSILIGNGKTLIGKKMICTMLCLLIAVAPHLLTVFSMMHAYAGLAMVAVMTACLMDTGRHGKETMLFFLLFAVNAVFIDAHLISESVKSGQVGKSMAVEAIRKTGEPARRVYVIIIEDDYPKLSSFCVVPSDAFGWGRAAQYETNNQWPEEIRDTTILRAPDSMQRAKKIGSEILEKDSFDCVWIVDGKHIVEASGKRQFLEARSKRQEARE